MLKKILFGLLITFLVLISVAGLLIYTGINYTKYDIKADLTKFPGVVTESDIHILAEKLLSEMTLEEKLQQMWGEKQLGGYIKLIANFIIKDQFPHVYVGKNDRLHIPPWVLSDGPRGAVVGTGNTAFPVAMARGASWDVALESRVADVIGKELRANGTNYNAAPCINLLMHPAWGRAQETYGEDPWLLGEFATAYIQSVQSHNVMACPKHFALNNIENSRFYVNVDLDERTLREVFLPHFKKSIQVGKSASIMSAYNQFRGDFVSHSSYLLTDILRNEWGFTGFVTSDWLNALRDGSKGVKAGMDIEMPFRNHYGNALEKAIADGEISEAAIDSIVLRVLKTRLPYAFLPDKMKYDESIKANAEHTNLAREVAEKSMVLLKNEGVLPFTDPAGKTIAVIGEIANLSNTGDRGSSNVRAPYVVTPYEGIRRYVDERNGTVSFHGSSTPETAAEVAMDADQVVLVVGFTHEDEGEYIVFSTDPVDNPEEISGNVIGGDRKSLSLKPKDVEMIKAVVAVNPNTVVAIVAGSAVTMQEWQSDAPAILYAWYAGMEGGNALARILYGEVNPSGKLPFTIPQTEDQLPPFNPWAKEVFYNYYHGYTLFEKKSMNPAFPFGFGLSYSSFNYTNLSTAKSNYEETDTLVFEVSVTNTGAMAGEEVVQLYIGFENSQMDRPVKLLRGFEKTNLTSGQTKSIVFYLPAHELAWYNPSEGNWEIERMVHQYYMGGSSTNTTLLKGEFIIN